MPDDVPAPFEYVGFGWNPQGHTPEGVYDVPHFDIHFYFNGPGTIGGIGPGVIEELPDEIIPEGYRLIEGGAIIPKMGAHMAPIDAPEFNGGEWEDTLIWGAADIGADEEYKLNFIEPMITLDYLEELGGVDSQKIAQPDEYPQDGHYPTTYVRRKLGDGGVVVALADFEAQED